MKQFIFILALLLVTNLQYAQSVVISSNTKEVNFGGSEEEKIYKVSAGLIKAKVDTKWSTSVYGVTISWGVVFSKKDGYRLYKNGKQIYQSTTVDGIRNKYLSILLGTESTNLGNLPEL